MRTIARGVPPRPALITAVAPTTAAAGSLLLQPRTADADPRPAIREGSAPDRRTALAPAAAARRALTATVPRTDPRLGHPHRQVLSLDPTNPADRSLKLGLTPYARGGQRGRQRRCPGGRFGPGHGRGAAYGFVCAPVWFTDFGRGVRVEQSYATGNPLVAGHWRPSGDGSGGPTDAAGRPSVVSGPHTVLFGTAPRFRDHPKGELPQVGQALFTMAHASSGSVEESG